jgi:putative hydrolase of the HAD superfamily
MIEAVIWDFGGVFTSSPFEAFNRYEAAHGLPADFIRQINSTNPDQNAWALFERNELTLDEFDTMFAREAEARGHHVPGRDVINLLSGTVRPAMVEALRRCKARVKVGCITNNVSAGEGAGMADTTEKAKQVAEILSLFDHVIESSKVGIRKPDPRIYQMACEILGVAPERSIYLDDLGINLKPAAALGMKTIKVTSAEQALAELQALVDFPVS